MRRFAALVMAIGLCAAMSAQAEDPKPAAPAEAAKPAETSAKSAGNPRVKFTTSKGEIVVELDAQKAPISTENFARYASEGHYNGTIFHRVMKTFVIQGGGFNAEMDEKREGLRAGIPNEWQNGLKNVRGSIAMARGPAADSGTAQFYINVVDNTSLLDLPRDGAAYAVFGKVVEGMDVVDKIRDVEVGTHPKYAAGGPVVPKETVLIEKATVEGADLDALKAASDKARAALIEAKEKPLRDLVAKIESETGKKFEKRPSGLMILIEKQGEGDSPTTANTITANYRGTLLNGKQFDSSYDKGQPLVYPLSDMVKGWQEGFPLLKKGSKAHLIIPPSLGYPGGNGPDIPPNSTLYFVVELLDFK